MEVDQEGVGVQPSLLSNSPICFFNRRIYRYWLSRVGLSTSVEEERTVGTVGNMTIFDFSSSISSFKRRFSSMILELLVTCWDIYISVWPILSIFSLSCQSSISLRCLLSASLAFRPPTYYLNLLFNRSYLCLYCLSCSLYLAAQNCAISAFCSASLTLDAKCEQLIESRSGKGSRLTQTRGAGSIKGVSVDNLLIESQQAWGQ